jgi:NADH dehydrogenase FAD-containing subunit
VSKIDPSKKTVYLESDEFISYDVMSFNVGSYVPKTDVTDKGRDIFTVKPIEELLKDYIAPYF